MKINYSDMNVVYIDPAIVTEGDGSTPAGALKEHKQFIIARTLNLSCFCKKV